jgi:ubiquinone/menaquinone biosynthesis C-methylase UbiE/uncharacterized protein YbaR (Trm112 family)
MTRARLQQSKITYPDGLLPSLREMSFVCPLCRGELNVLEDGYACEACPRTYRLHAGIPDFRVFPDPYLNWQEDRERTEIVLKALDKYKLEELLEYYWSFSDITPVDLRAKFIRSVRLGEARARRSVEMLDEENTGIPGPKKRILEIGSGTGNFLAEAIGGYEKVVGVDIAMRWLHVSRRRFMDRGLPVPALVCCCAEYLPFADASFDVVTMTSTLEFTADQEKVLSECERVLAGSGTLYINSVNRFSLASDPYAYLWGVGFLPRSLQARYVYWRRGAHYKTKTLSQAELNRMARTKFASIKFNLPDVSQTVVNQLAPLTRLQIRAYQFLKRLPVFPFVFKQLGPGWDVILHKS